MLGFSFIIAVVVVAVCYYVFRKCYLTTAQELPEQRFRDNLSQSKQRCFLIVVLLLFLSYPSVCSVIITLLPTGCKLFYLDEDKELNVTLLRYNYAIRCDDPGHSIFNYAAQTSLVYVVGFPLVLFLLLWSSKGRLYNTKKTILRQDSDQVLPESEATVSNLPTELPHMCQDRVDDTEDDVTDDPEAPVLSQDSDQEVLDISVERTDETHQHVAQPEAVVSHVSTETSEPATRISWESFLCENYKAQFWYWEIIELSRKILQTLFILLFGPEDHFSLFASVVLSVFFLLIHAYLKPMKDAAEQRLQMCSLGTIFLNMLAASLLLMPNDTGPLGEYNKGVLSVTLVLLNLSIIVFVACK